MIFGLDTNVLVRLLVQDDEKQVRIASGRITREVERDNDFYVSDLVILEAIWVLESCYNATRDNIIQALEQMMVVAHFRFESIDVLHKFVETAKDTTADLSDILIGISGTAKGCASTLTFDKKAARLEGFEYLKNV